MSKRREIHPAANIFPLMADDDLEKLQESIEEHGQQEPVILWKDQVIDGRNRMIACENLGIEPSEAMIDDGDDPVQYSISANLHRRHLTQSQLAMCAAKVAGLPHGTNQHNTEELQICNSSTLEDSAELFGCSKRSVSTALEVIRTGAKDVVKKCEAGDLPVSTAAKIIEHASDKREQSKVASYDKKDRSEWLKGFQKPRKTESSPSETDCNSEASTDAAGGRDPQIDADIARLEKELEPSPGCEKGEPCPHCGGEFWRPDTEEIGDGGCCDACKHPRTTPRDRDNLPGASSGADTAANTTEPTTEAGRDDGGFLAYANPTQFMMCCTFTEALEMANLYCGTVYVPIPLCSDHAALFFVNCPNKLVVLRGIFEAATDLEREALRGWLEDEKPANGKPKKFDPRDATIPDSLDTEEFRRAWLEWCRHKSEKGQGIKKTSCAKTLVQFAKWGPERSVIAIDHTILKGWAGIQEPKDGASTMRIDKSRATL